MLLEDPGVTRSGAVEHVSRSGLAVLRLPSPRVPALHRAQSLSGLLLSRPTASLLNQTPGMGPGQLRLCSCQAISVTGIPACMLGKQAGVALNAGGPVPSGAFQNTMQSDPFPYQTEQTMSSQPSAQGCGVDGRRGEWAGQGQFRALGYTEGRVGESPG